MISNHRARLEWSTRPGLTIRVLSSTLSLPAQPLDHRLGAISSVGRALQSHCRGHWFEPSIAHHSILLIFKAIYLVIYLCKR